MARSIQPRTFHSRTNRALASGVELFAPALARWAQRQAGGEPLPPRRWKRALILGASHIGDLLYRTASLDALKTGLPDCELYYLTAPATADILAGHPSLRAVLAFARSESPLELSREHQAALRDLRCDAALCTNSTGYWAELLLAIRLGIPSRVAYTHKGFSGWVTHAVPFRYPQSYSAYFRDYVAYLTEQDPTWSLRPDLRQRRRGGRGRRGVAATRSGRSQPVLACFMTDTPADAPVASRALDGHSLLRRQTRLRIVLSGATSDRAVLDTFNRAFDLDAAVIAGELELRSLYCLLTKCAAALVTDSGPRHIANAAGLPVYFVRNLRTNRVETGSYLDTELDLAPSEDRVPAVRQAAVLETITPEMVADAILHGLKAGPCQP
jgi:ADP-heptose:LPS heptosyltransferase